MRWKQLASADDFSRLLQDSYRFPVIIFKHSTRCATSSVALNRIQRDGEDGDGEIEFYYLDVIAYRELSKQIADKLDVLHQSPQLLLIRNGKCVHNASHLSISFESVEKKLKEAA